ncbi:MAG TPA: ABC transporter permease [Vicinamibacteria bacterium]|nr:ABC transporter permease [Vicinamibacteria bacterium]
MAALGGALGATVGLFSVLNAVLLADPPFREAGRVVFLRHSYTGFVAAASVPTFLDYRRQTRAFEALSAAVPWEANLAGDGEAERVHGLQVTAEFFAMLGVAAFRGRTFLAGEDEPGREHVVVVSHGLWQRRFGRDPTLVGRTLRLNDEPYEVVGILPPGFVGDGCPARRLSVTCGLPMRSRPSAVRRRAAATSSSMSTVASGPGCASSRRRPSWMR